MAATLQFIEIPGYREAIRRETDVRRKGWVHTHTDIAGVRVRILTLRDMVFLEEIQNGFFAPWRFDTEEELLGHAAQLVWWLSDCPKPNPNETKSFLPLVSFHRARLISYLAQRPKELADGVQNYIREMFLDSPKGGGSSGQAIAATPAYIADTLAAGGFSISLGEMMDMPVTRLWQLLRVSARRVYGAPQTNESDRIACDYLDSLNQGNN